MHGTTRIILTSSCLIGAVYGGLAMANVGAAETNHKINVLVWDEQQVVPKPVYPNFPGNFIADHLSKNEQLQVTSATLKDPDQGLSSETLRQTDVLVYWDHRRHADISEAKSQEIVDLIKEGKLAMMTLHSAHWSKPFMVAMQEKAAQDALERLSAEERANAVVKFQGEIGWHMPGDYERNFLEVQYRRAEDGRTTVLVGRPRCVFPRCCTPMQPSLIRVVNPSHPITQGVPKNFALPETEMYDEPFHVPEPDEVVLDETWKGGEYFRSGCVWNLGKGKVFYFRPGDEDYNVYNQDPILQIIENACVWLGH